MAKKTRIIVVATGVPEDVGGAPIRNYQLLKALSGLKDSRVDLFCICVERRFAAKKQQLESDLPIQSHFVAHNPGTVLTKLYAVFVARMQPHMVAYRYRTKLGKAVWDYCVQNRVDVIHIEQIDAYYCLEPYIVRLQELGIKVVLDEHNIEADVLIGTSKSLKFPLNIIGGMMVGSLRKLEQRAVTTVDAIFACSEVDAAWFRRIRTDNQVYVVPNGVDCSQFTPSSIKQSNSLIFIGSPNYPPNADALGYYLQCIHPLVKEAVPDVRLDIIGRNSEEWLNARLLGDDETVVSHGFVPDIKGYLDSATIGICPIRAGSGTRLKVLTYMSAGIPVVSTTKGAEGIDYSADTDVVIADTEIEFAEQIISLLKDKKRRQLIGNKARLLMEQQYDWLIIAKRLRRDYELISKQL